MAFQGRTYLSPETVIFASLKRRPVQPDMKARMIAYQYVSQRSKGLANSTNRITIRGVEVVVVNATDSIFVTFGSIVEAVKHQILRSVREQVLILLNSDDQRRANEAAPVRIPRIVYVRCIGRRTNVWLLWIFLVVTVPGCR
jgi:hypothetical protein